MASAIGMKDFVSSKWTSASEDAPPDSAMSDISRRVANDPAVAPRSKQPSAERDEAATAAPIPPLSRHLKQIAVSVVAVGAAFYGITTMTAWYRQSGDVPAPHRGLSVKIASIPVGDVAEPNAQIAARFGALTLAQLEAERLASSKPDPVIAVVPSKISKVEARENLPPAAVAPLTAAPAADAPLAAAPPADAPLAAAPATVAPLAETPATVAPLTAAPAADAPLAAAPATVAPLAETPATVAPLTAAPAADAPLAAAPATVAPLAETPATVAPLAAAPAADAPLAAAPTTVAPLPAEPTTVAPLAAAPTTETTPASSAPPEATVAEITELLARGDDLLASGNIAAARLFYSRAASLGSGRAATMSGKTYDPRFLATIPVSGIAPDQDQAAIWYRRGVALGDGESAERLAGLTASGQ